MEERAAKSYYAICLIRGLEVEKEAKRGLKLLNEACEEGDTKAYSNLAYCYHYGHGLSRIIADNLNIHSHLSLSEIFEEEEGLSRPLPRRTQSGAYRQFRSLDYGLR